MKSVITFVAISATLLVMSGCDRSRNFDMDTNAVADSVSIAAPAKDSAGVSTSNAATLERQFIRTSEIKFRVKDVRDATTQIENIIRQHQGFVTYTNLKSDIENKETIQKSLDSSLESIRYAVTNDIILRIPNAQLDSTLASISALVDYMDYRVIKADDVALQIKSNEMEQRRAQLHGQQVHQLINTRKAKLQHATNAVELSSEQQSIADNATLSNLSLKDQVAYSTVNLSIYQRAETKYWVIANDSNKTLRASIGIRIWDSIKTGWYFMEDIFVGILNLWFLVVAGVIGYLIYKKYVASRKKMAVTVK